MLLDAAAGIKVIWGAGGRFARHNSVFERKTVTIMTEQRNVCHKVSWLKNLGRYQLFTYRIGTLYL